MSSREEVNEEYLLKEVRFYLNIKGKDRICMGHIRNVYMMWIL